MLRSRTMPAADEGRNRFSRDIDEGCEEKK
jgi:hypothetical protein